MIRKAFVAYIFAALQCSSVAAQGWLPLAQSGPWWISACGLTQQPNNVTTLPSACLDFVNSRYFDGSGASTLAALVSGSPTIDAAGLLCNVTTNLANGNLLTALQSAGGATATTKLVGGVASTAKGIIGIGSSRDMLFQAVGNQGESFNGVALVTTNTADWTLTNWLSGSESATARAVSLNAVAAATLATGFTTPTAASICSRTGSLPFTGHMQFLAAWNSQLNPLILQKLSQAPPWIYQYGFNMVGNQTASAGTVFNYEYTQPWSYQQQAAFTSKPATASMLFTNVDTGAAHPGYELWFNSSGNLVVRIIHDIAVSYIEVASTADYSDGVKRVYGATYDGSGTAAGVILYVDGVAISSTVNKNTLGGLSIIGGTQNWSVGYQPGSGFLFNGTLGAIRFSNVVRNAAYMASLQPVDANAVGAWNLTEGSGTSAAGLVGGINLTLSAAAIWVLYQ